MSKGSNPRPYSVDQKTFDSNWDSIFKKKEDEQLTEDKEQKEKEDKNELG
jgi:hypothetical protein